MGRLGGPAGRRIHRGPGRAAAVGAGHGNEASPASRDGANAGHESCRPVDGPGLVLHAFAMVAAAGPEITPGGAITATLSFDTADLALPAGQIAQAKADVYARRPPPANSVLGGSVLADISPGESVRLATGVIANCRIRQPRQPVFEIVTPRRAAGRGGWPPTWSV